MKTFIRLYSCKNISPKASFANGVHCKCSKETVLHFHNAQRTFLGTEIIKL